MKVLGPVRDHLKFGRFVVSAAARNLVAERRLPTFRRRSSAAAMRRPVQRDLGGRRCSAKRSPDSTRAMSIFPSPRCCAAVLFLLLALERKAATAEKLAANRIGGPTGIVINGDVARPRHADCARLLTAGSHSGARSTRQAQRLGTMPKPSARERDPPTDAAAPTARRHMSIVRERHGAEIRPAISSPAWRHVRRRKGVVWRAAIATKMIPIVPTIHALLCAGSSARAYFVDYRKSTAPSNDDTRGVLAHLHGCIGINNRIWLTR